MKILFVNPGRALGGAEESLLLLIQGLRAHGVEAAVALFGDGPFKERLSSFGVATTCLDPPRHVERAGRYHAPGPLGVAALVAAGLPTALRLAALTRQRQADVIHTNGMKAHLIGGLAGRLARVPVVSHLRDFPPAGWGGMLFRRATCRLPTLVLAVSDAVARAVRPAHGNRVRAARIYDPIDVARFHPGLPRERVRRQLGIGPAVPLVGLIAHLTPWKGHELFLAVAKAVVEAGVDGHFIVAGGSIYETNGHAGYAEALRRQANALGLSDRVRFLGARSDIPEILAALDVLVHCPTAPEPFGRVLAEAMAVGRPVVAARCGGLPEVVADGVTGLLVEPGDVAGFTSSVIRLLGDPALRKQFGNAGRRRAQDLFGIEDHIAGVLNAYRAVA